MDLQSSRKPQLQLTGWRYTLRGVLVFVSVVAVSLSISRLFHPAWGRCW